MVESAHLAEEVETHHVGLAVRAGRTKADRTEDPRQERHVVVLERRVAHLAPLVQRGDHVQAEDVGLALFERRGLLLQRGAHRARAVERVLDAQTVGHLVEHRVGEEGVERDVAALVLGDQFAGDGHQDAVEFGPHRVLELQPAGPLGQLDFLVVGQVDRDRLRTGVALTGVVHHVVSVEFRVGSRGLSFVRIRNGQAALQIGQESGVARQPLAPLHVLDQHVTGEAGFGAEQLVLVRFDRADDDVETVVLHVHPGHVAGLVVVALHRVGA